MPSELLRPHDPTTIGPIVLDPDGPTAAAIMARIRRLGVMKAVAAAAAVGLLIGMIGGPGPGRGELTVARAGPEFALVTAHAPERVDENTLVTLLRVDLTSGQRDLRSVLPLVALLPGGPDWQEYVRIPAGRTISLELCLATGTAGATLERWLATPRPAKTVDLTGAADGLRCVDPAVLRGAA